MFLAEIVQITSACEIKEFVPYATKIIIFTLGMLSSYNNKNFNQMSQIIISDNIHNKLAPKSP